MAKKHLLVPPIAPFVATQKFGENRTCIETDGSKTETLPKSGAACSPGYEPFYIARGMRGHNGIDFSAAEGLPVYAAHSGRVTELSNELERGIGVGIVTGRRFEFPDPRKRNGIGRYRLKTRYWYLMAYAVALGERVRAGQLIGWAGNTGFSSGPHLHFELKPVERVSKGKYRNSFPHNGYHGAIDPAPYLAKRSGNQLEA